MSEVKPERTGWRDENISKHHRLWGVACPATDLDFILVESNAASPLALIEYKNEFAPAKRLDSWQYLILKELGDRARLPVFVARYKTDFSEFIVKPINKIAEQRYKGGCLSEEKFVKLLYWLRGQEVPQEVLRKIGAKEVKQ